MREEAFPLPVFFLAGHLCWRVASSQVVDELKQSHEKASVTSDSGLLPASVSELCWGPVLLLLLSLWMTIAWRMFTIPPGGILSQNSAVLTQLTHRDCEEVAVHCFPMVSFEGHLLHSNRYIVHYVSDYLCTRKDTFSLPCTILFPGWPWHDFYH